MSSLILRATTPDDLAYVVNAERSPENRDFVSVWSNAQHQHALRDPDIRHLTLEPSTGGDRLGYVILAGLAAQTGVIEFRRLVVTAKGQGYGHGSVRRVQDLAFESLGAHRPGWM